LIVAATLANLVFKAGIVAMVGSRELLARVVALFAFPMLGGLALIWLWP